MKILHLGSSPLGSGILRVLQETSDHIIHAEDLSTARKHLAEGDVDWIVSAGFRSILSANDLALARDSCNVHPSLLPWGRGANPNVWMLAEGEPAGVSIHRMVPELDAGPVFAQRRVESLFSDDARRLHERLTLEAIALFGEVWDQMRSGRLLAQEQRGLGSYHRVADMNDLGDIDLDTETTWGDAINVLRSLTFPPYRNALVQKDGRTYNIEVRIEEID